MSSALEMANPAGRLARLKGSAAGTGYPNTQRYPYAIPSCMAASCET
jgi:hypothetical protein